MASALESLTATYTDSEGEEDGHDERNENDNDQYVMGSPHSPEGNRSNMSSQQTSPVPIKITTKVAKLVSYIDDTFVSDDEGESEYLPHEVTIMKDTIKNDDENFVDEVGLIPPEPSGHCSTELQDKITKLYDKMLTQQMDMNAVIQKRKDFRNPSIYEKLIQFCDLNELGTNYPPSMYDPLKWNKESTYEELAKVQKTEMDKREKDRKAKVEFVSGSKKSDEDKKRKSKWDQSGGGNAAPQSIKPAGLVQPTLTTSSTGTKGTVISAFGSLPKKPRP